MKLPNLIDSVLRKINLVSLSSSALIFAVTSTAANAAEKIRFFVGPKEVVVSIEALETFANTGEVINEFAFYAQYLDENSLNWFQEFLSQDHVFPIVPLNKMLNSTIGRDLLEELGTVVRTHANLNGHQSIRAALLTAAAEGANRFRIIDVFRQYPSQSIRISTGLLLEMEKKLSIYGEYAESVADAIAMTASNNTLETEDFPGLLAMPGPYQFSQFTETLNFQRVRQTGQGLSGGYSFGVDVYLPEASAWPAPIVAISHGFGSVKENFEFIAEHLASYGYAVVVPEHVGSDLGYRQEFLAGNLSSALSPLEYLDRPQDISFVLDELERISQDNPRWIGRINVDKVGVLGASLGGATVLSLAGAQLNQARLQQDCATPRLNLNFSEILQCQASHLPPLDLSLKDPRVDAAIAAHPLSSSLFGPEGMKTIDIPLALIAGSKDLVTPFVLDQVHPFIWLNNSDKYLALLDPGTHWATTLQAGGEGTEGLPEFLLGNTSDTGREVFKAFAIAFFNRYLKNNEDYSDYLIPRSVRGAVGEHPLTMHLVRDLTAEAIETSYGQTPPFPIVPEPLTEDVPVFSAGDRILQEIARTGVLKVGIRRDASPFGYIDASGQWTGYCTDLAREFARHLETVTNSDVDIDVIQLQSTLDNRFDLVRNRTVHLECGPNTIRDDVDGVSFSNLFFVTGTHFFTPLQKAADLKPSLDMSDIEIGVLRNTTSENFISSQYPQAQTIYFEGDGGRQEAIRSLANGTIDTFATDGILALGEAVIQQLPLNEYKLIPDRPLTCDYYGFVLPAGDPEWLRTVNQWLASDASGDIWDSWFEERIPYVLLDLDYCINLGN